MQDELYEFKRHNIWTFVPYPPRKTIVGTHYVFHKKMDEYVVITRNMDRLVTQGFTQLERLDYDETFSPVAYLEAIRVFFAYAYFMNFKVFQVDVKIEFLHRDLE